MAISLEALNKPPAEVIIDDEDESDEIILAELEQVKVTGIQNFRGVANLKPNTEVELRRDTINITDKHAIEIRFPDKGAKIGMLSKSLSAKLAPLMDSKLVETKCIVTSVPKSVAVDHVVLMNVVIKGYRYLLTDPRISSMQPKPIKPSKDTTPQAETQEIMFIEPPTSTLAQDILMSQSLLIERQDGVPDYLGDLFKEGAVDPASLPIHPCPPGKKDRTMKVNLMTFQKQGLAWMIKMEHPQLPTRVDEPPVQLWSYKLDTAGIPFYYNLATETMQRNKPMLKRGGILADEMGLGKTMQTIALICTDDTGEGVLPEPEEPDDRYDDMTLIVCPLSVASNWTDQFQRHVGTKRLRWHLYHGDGRNLSKKDLRKYDVIITTYQTLVLENTVEEPRKDDNEPPAKKAKNKMKEGTLFMIKWRRVVLDEGHLIKNPKAKMSMACVNLKAERRWVLTGTPIVNAVADLGAMMCFLKLCRPLDTPAEWARCIDSKLKDKDDHEAGAKLLRAVVSSTTLRRTKNMSDSSGKKLVQLPPVQFFVHRVKLSKEAQDLYDEISHEVASIVQGMFKEGSVKSFVTGILVWLLRLRQVACDPDLCPQSFISEVRNHALQRRLEIEFTQGPQLSPSRKDTLKLILRRARDTEVECTICMDTPHQARIAPCEHIFCAGCIGEVLQIREACPIDGMPLRVSQLIADGTTNNEEDAEAGEEKEVLEYQAKNGTRSMTGAAKTQQLIMLLKATEPGVKSLVFSQWTSHLNLIEVSLKEAGISTCRFDGSMSQSRREDLIASFSEPIEESKKKYRKGSLGPPTVMLISLQAGALGLNLTCASQIFLMDPWWQGAIEAQAIDRVNRIGQTKAVKVFQIIAEGTVEDRVLAIQKQKEQLVSQAFSGSKQDGSRSEKIESRLKDIASIFGVEM